MGSGGRKLKLTLERQEEICRAIRAGNYKETAAILAGIGRRTLHTWLQKGEMAETGVYRDFYEAVQKAEAVAEVRDVTIIAQAAKGGVQLERRTITHPDGSVEIFEKFSEPEWQAAAWRLERALPKRWGRRQPDEVMMTTHEAALQELMAYADD